MIIRVVHSFESQQLTIAIEPILISHLKMQVFNPVFHRKKTNRYSTIDLNASKLSSNVEFLINLQVNCPYSASIIEKVLKLRPWCKMLNSSIQVIQTESPGKLSKVMQIGDFENIEWENVMSSSQMASSYLVRKGLSRKAQLAMQIKRYLSKHRSSILLTSTPYTLIIQTWEAFENMKVDFGGGSLASFDDTLVVSVSLRQRLEWCLDDVKESMENLDCKHWILKSSVTNKGADIVIVKNWASLLDALNESPDIREWVLQK